MEFKINFIFIVSLIFAICVVICFIYEFVKCIREKRKKTISDMAFENFCFYIGVCHAAFLIKKDGLSKELLGDKWCAELCDECSHKHSCANGFVPKCLVIDEELLDKIHCYRY